MKYAWAAVVASVAVIIALWLRGGGDADEAHPGAAAIARPSQRTAESTAATMLTGQVRRASDGTPIAGAVIAISPAEQGHLEQLRIVIADADGNWTAPAQAGRVRITASARGFAPSSKEVDLQPDVRVELALSSGGSVVHGEIVDVTGGPTPGIQLAFQSMTATVIATADQTGHYEVTLRDGFYTYTSIDDAYAESSQASCIVDGHDRRCDLDVVPAATISGRVVAAGSHAPVADAVVEVSGGVLFRPTSASTRTAADGTFTVRRLMPGALQLTVRAQHHASRESSRVEIALGEQRVGVEVVVDPAYVVRGRALVDGTPAPNILVYAGGDRATNGSGHTAADGTFELSGLLPGRYKLTLPGVDNAANHVEILDRDQEGVVVAGHSAKPAPARVVSGRVDPAKPASVEFLYPRERTSADAHGQFRLELGNASPGWLRATAPDGSVGLAKIDPSDADLHDVVVAMKPGARVSGRVVTAKGSPVGWSEVFVRIRAEGAAIDTVAGADGRFEIDHLTAGTAQVWAQDPAHGGPMTKAIVVQLTPGQELRDVTLVLPALDHAVRGRAIDEQGAPIADAWVMGFIRPGGVMLPSTPTRSDGTFSFPDAVDGDVFLTAEGPRGDSNGKAEGHTDTPIDIVLHPQGAITGRVSRNGAPVTSFEITCGRDFGSREHVTSADGSFVVDHLRRGTYRCFATSEQGQASAEVVLSGPTATVELQVGSGSVSGTAIDGITGKPMAGLQVFVEGADRQVSPATVQTDERGHFNLGGVPLSGSLTFDEPGEYRFSDAAKFAIQGDSPVELGEIRLPPDRHGKHGYIGFQAILKDAALTVELVDADGPASVTGIRVGDRITSYDGTLLTGYSGTWLLTLLYGAIVGQPFQLGLERGLTVTITPVAP